MNMQECLKRLTRILSEDSTSLVGFNIEMEAPTETYAPVGSEVMRVTTTDRFNVNISLNMSRESVREIEHMSDSTQKHMEGSES